MHTRSSLLALIAIVILPSALLAAERVPWTSSRVVETPDAPKPYAIKRVFPKLQFQQPVELVPLGNSGKMLLLEVDGKAYVFDDDQGCEQADLILDLKPIRPDFSRAFTICPHPDFDQNREVFIVYAHNPVARPDGSRLSRFTLSLDGIPQIDPASEEVLLTWASGGHNGSTIRFDKEGLLYFSAGDGARPYPPDEYDVSQDLSDLRSTICRINVDKRDGERGYSVPADNPFINIEDARPEIWAFGFRNPWRFSIDPLTQDVLCGDVGWELWELIFHVEQGGNYGWSIFEGPQPIRSDIAQGPAPIRKPLVAYPHTDGLSVTGGFTYRGDSLSEISGHYLYGDYVTGLIWGMTYSDGKVASNKVLAEAGIPIISFCESRGHEPFVLSYSGQIYQLIKNPAVGKPSDFPLRLSETGLFTSTETLELAPGVYPYTARATAYRDGATSQFALGVPGHASIVTGKQKRNWKYPKDTVFAKTLSMDVLNNNTAQTRRIETQLLHFDGSTWHPYCYVWNDAQTEANLIDAAGGNSKFQVPSETGPLELSWRHHGRSECRACHIQQTGGALAFSYENLGDMQAIASHPPAPSKPSEEYRDQIDWFIDLGILDKRAQAGWKTRQMVNTSDSAASLDDRARSYLAANCAHCHCRGGGGTVALDLSYSNETANINAVDFPTTQGTFGLPNAKVVVPGDPYRSVMFYRLATNGTGHMPKLWTRQNDAPGLKLIHDWIASMDPDTYQTTLSQDLNSKPHESKPHESLAANPSALMHFSELLDAKPEIQLQAAEHAMEDADAVTVGIYERFLPAEKRVQRLGNNIDQAMILALDGDSAAGRERFLNSKVQQCRNCHRYAGQGQMVGPDLEGIAKQRSREELLASIISPSDKIDPVYATYSVLTADGQLLSGLKLPSEDGTIIIRTADGKTHTLPPDEVEQMTRQPTSLMPSGLAAEMTARELADLLAFLSELK